MKSLDALVLCAMCAAEDLAFGLDAMADHAAFAVGATRCQSVNGKFEAVERHGLSGKAYAEGLVVVVAANITSRHDLFLAAYRKRRPPSVGCPPVPLSPSRSPDSPFDQSPCARPSPGSCSGSRSEPQCLVV